jgi:hypothetical protein
MNHEDIELQKIRNFIKEDSGLKLVLKALLAKEKGSIEAFIGYIKEYFYTSLAIKTNEEEFAVSKDFISDKGIKLTDKQDLSSYLRIKDFKDKLQRIVSHKTTSEALLKSAQTDLIRISLKYPRENNNSLIRITAHLDQLKDTHESLLDIDDLLESDL